MAFLESIGGDNKQRINFSQFALNTIHDDMIAFGNNHITNFINKIIANYKYESEASIGFVLEKEKNRLEEIFTNIKIDEQQKNIAIKKLCDVRKQELMQKFSSYEKYESYAIRLWKETVEYLTDPYSDCKEERYYNHKVGNYLKAIIEDYASKPFSERELIYYSDRVKLIKTAIEEKRGLIIRTSKDKVRLICPYSIEKDSMSMYNYLVGYSENEKSNTRYPASMRLSGMTDIKMKGTHKSLKKDEIKKLNDAISRKGVQFLIGKEDKIVVVLTEAGKHKFANQLHLRPNCVDVLNGNEYVFNCTPAQAEFYFVKFGKDAYIKEPELLHCRVKDIYKDAYEAYNK